LYTKPVDDDYEGDHVDYKKRKLLPVCPTVMPALANASREFVSMLWERDDAAELVQMGQQMKIW
jgi:hypothetical protein